MFIIVLKSHYILTLNCPLESSVIRFAVCVHVYLCAHMRVYVCVYVWKKVLLVSGGWPWLGWGMSLVIWKIN